MRTRLNSLIGALFLAQLGAVAAHAEELNLYTTREPKLVEPLLASFTEKTGITVNTIFLKDGMPPIASGGRYDALTAVLGAGAFIPAVGGVIRPGLVARLKGAVA